MTRISTALSFKIGIDSIQNQQRELNNTQFQISTGKRVNSPADDPISSSRLLNLRQEERIVEQYQENVNIANSNIATTETAISNVINRLIRAKELAIQSANGTLASGDRFAIITELSEILDEVVATGNTRTGSDFAFAGFLNREQPVVRLVDGTYEYRGDEGLREISIGSSTSVQITDTAKAMFFDVAAADMSLNTFTGQTTVTSANPGLVAPGSLAVLANAELIINGIDIEAATADTVSTTDNAASAIAIAAAINNRTNLHEVIATANSNDLTLTTVTTGGTLAAGQFTINGVDIVGTTAGGITDLETLINAQTTLTGVTATVAGANIDLSAADGRNIRLTTAGGAVGVNIANFVLTGAAQDLVTRSTVTLNHHDPITIAGSSPLDAGFTAGVTNNLGNTGTATISTPIIVNNNQITTDDETYLIRFDSPTTFSIFAESDPNTALAYYTPADPDVPVVGPAQTYTPGDTIIFQGIEVTISGTPVAGDSFTIDVNPVATKDIFTNIQDLINNLGTNPNDSDRFTYLVGVGIQNIDNAIDKLSERQANIGARLNLLQQQENSNEQFILFAQEGLSQIEDLDYYQAISDLTRRRFSLDAAQRSFVRIQELSLFNFI